MEVRNGQSIIELQWESIPDPDAESESEPETKSAEVSTKEKPQPKSREITILGGRHSITPPHSWGLAPSATDKSSLFHSNNSSLLLNLLDSTHSPKVAADIHRRQLQSPAKGWQNGFVGKLTHSENPSHESYQFGYEGTYHNSDERFYGRCYFSRKKTKSNKEPILAATMTTTKSSPDHKAGLRLVTMNFLERLQPGPGR